MKVKSVNTVGARIRGLRDALGLNQSAFAMKLATRPSTVSKWEAGRNRPSPDVFVKIARLADGADKLFFLDQAGVPDEFFMGSPMLPELLRASTRVVAQTLPGSHAAALEVFPGSVSATSIPLINHPSKVGTRDAVKNIENVLALPSEWIPRQGQIQAARFPNPGVPLIDGDLIGLIDVDRRDPDRLLGCVVAVRAVDGLEAMKLSRDGSSYLLTPFRADANACSLRPSGPGSIVGRIIKWIADTPCPELPDNVQVARKLKRKVYG